MTSHLVQSTASVHDLRAGRHDCFDRVVVDLGHVMAAARPRASFAGDR